MYTAFVVLAGWVLFALETPAGILNYFRAMFGMAGAVIDREGLYLGREYLLLFVIAAAASVPFFGRLAARVRKARTGIGIAVYSLGEKIIPAALLLLAIAGIVEATYNPFLYFRF